MGSDTDRPGPGGPGGSGGVANRLAEGFLRDALVNSAGLCSALVVAVGLFKDASAWSSVAVVLGGFGMALPMISLNRGRSTRVLRMVVRGVLLADLALLVMILFSV